jgi:translocation and assembly module TamA
VLRLNRHVQILLASLAIFSSAVCADEVEYLVTGIDEPLLSNVLDQVSAYRIGRSARLNSRLRRKLLEDAKIAATKAVRPFGYFHPVVSVDIEQKETGKWLLSVNVTAGPPVLIQELHLELTGAGSELDSLAEWYAAFPLGVGQVLLQPDWDKAKLDALDLLEEVGFLQPRFVRHTIRVDTVANTAKLDLVLDTGPQAVMGTVTFNQDILQQGILEGFQRFQSGDAYNRWLLEKFRLDLWRSGYFQDIEIVERRELDASVPRVDLEVNLTARKKNTYQGTIGYGTDTQARLQFLWGRHLLSPRGDNFDVGFGWQQKDNEFTVQANYRLPRKTNPQQFWITSAGIKSEKQSLEVSADGDLENRFDIARGTINDWSLRLGKTRARNLQGGFQQLFETVYVQYLHEQQDFNLTENADSLAGSLLENDPVDDLLKHTSNSLALGLEWDWPEIRGNGFQTVGHHERAWIFTSNDAWGSEVEYSQVYISSRRNFLLGSQWKVLLRAEAAYSDARVEKYLFPTVEGELELEITTLPKLYRFQAGGSRSVRGYEFEILDNNGLGSNHLFTASAELEYHFHENWSAAAFVDTGNAFNDWSKPELKLGTGVGIRWYSVIGAVRLDFAQGWDLRGDPWRIHLTIGTPLL